MLLREGLKLANYLHYPCHRQLSKKTTNQYSGSWAAFNIPQRLSKFRSSRLISCHNSTSCEVGEKKSRKMTITTIPTTPVIQDGCLLVNGKVVFTQVPQNIVISPVSFGSAFVGATSPTSGSRHVFSLGLLQKCTFLSLFRFKIWWMMPRVGHSGSEVPLETQMLLLEAKEESPLLDEETDENNTFYILVLPVLEGAFRASLQGSSTNELQFCVESGDPDVQTTHVSESVFINSGDNPYELMKNSIKILAEHN